MAVSAPALLERARRREENGDDDGAIADFENAAVLAQEGGDASSEMAARAGLVRLHLAAGHTQEVDVQLEHIERTMSPLVAPIARAEALCEWGLVLIERGADAQDRLTRRSASSPISPISPAHAGSKSVR